MTGTAPILIVDDEPAIRLLLARALTRLDRPVIEADCAAAALAVARAKTPALVLLDLGLPDRDGLELIPSLVATGTAVIVLTARDASAEKVAALDLGAEDYVTKPFDTEELLARIRSALRRHGQAAIGDAPLKIGAIALDIAAHRVTRDGIDVHLTPKEFALFVELAKHPGRVVTHQHLLRTVWGNAHERDVEYLRVAIRALRTKLEADPANPHLIRNEPGIGYRLIE